MSPYTFKILRLVGGGVFSISFTSLVTIYTTLRSVSHSVLLFGLVAVGLAGLAAYVLFYFLQISETNNLVGIYMRARELKKTDERLAKAFKIQPYNKYYRKRKEDNAIRESLKTSPGVVILGQPFSGKTRAALEAAVETRPDAYIVSFISPDQLTSDKIKKIFLPCFFIFFAKPTVILLVDDARRFAHCPFEELWARLHKQCSRISIIATCRSGVDEKTLAEGEIQQLVRGLPRVKLGPLEPEARIDIYSHVWNEKPGPLGLDMSLPGLIVFGPKGMRDTYGRLPVRSKRVITALGLARACGTEACEREFLNEILKNVLAQDIVGIEAAISDMEDKYVLVVDERDRISLQNDEFVVADYKAHYSTFHDLKKDLRKVESLSAVSGNADRLLQLGLYYWSRFQDFESARRTMESSLQVKASPLAHTSLARLSMWLDEPERARAAINAAVAASKEENQKAVILTLFGDEIWFKRGDAEKAAGWYALAAEHAEDRLTSASIMARQGDCLFRLKRFSEAESIYRNYLAKSPTTEKSAATARLALTMLAQDRAPEARSLLRRTWSGMARQECVDLAMLVVENGEGFFFDMASHLQRTSDAVWEEYRNFVLSLRESDSISFLLFADSCLTSGFLTPALTAYRSLIGQPAKFGIQEVDVVYCWLNLGAGLRDRQQFADARAAFASAEKLVRQNPDRRNALTYVFAGLADCDLFEKQSESEAAPQYREALDQADEYGDENAKSWAKMGLGDVAIMNRNFVQAKEHYSAPILIESSVSSRSRINLGLARACLELDELDDAEIYIANGIASTSRLDYRFRQMQFQELRKRLAKKLDTKPTSTVAAS